MEISATRITRSQCSASSTEPSPPTCLRVAKSNVHKLLDMAVKTRAMRVNCSSVSSLWDIRSSIRTFSGHGCHALVLMGMPLGVPNLYVIIAPHLFKYLRCLVVYV